VEGCKGLAHRETSGSRSSYTLSVKLFPAGQQRTWAVHNRFAAFVRAPGARRRRCRGPLVGQGPRPGPDVSPTPTSDSSDRGRTFHSPSSSLLRKSFGVTKPPTSTLRSPGASAVAWDSLAFSGDIGRRRASPRRSNHVLKGLLARPDPWHGQHGSNLELRPLRVAPVPSGA
jgi:hypothetical protein